MKRTPLRRCSKKQAAALKQYAVLRKEYLADHPFCECQFVLHVINGVSLFLSDMPSCQEASSQIHHMKRRGKNLNDTFTWMAVCRDHHREIETHATAARKVGLILP